ncbi:MAG: LysE family transporter [Thermomicrobiales bacterium]
MRHFLCSENTEFRDGWLAAVAATGVMIGLAYAAVPGPVNTESLRRTLGSGFRSGFLVHIGAILGDLLWASIAFAGAMVLLDNDLVGFALGIIGGTFLLKLAKTSLTSQFRISDAPPVQVIGSAVRIGITFGLANPASIAFWTGIGAGTLDSTRLTSPSQGLFLIGSFVLGTIIWDGFLVGVGCCGRAFVSARTLGWIDTGCAAILAWFGFQLVDTSIARIWTMIGPSISQFIHW